MCYLCMYILPKTSPWYLEDYNNILGHTRICLDSIMKTCNKLMIMGDFNCIKVNWEDWMMSERDKVRENALLKLMMENIIIHLVSDYTRYRGQDKPSRLDLVSTN